METALHAKLNKILQGKYLQKNDFVATISFSVFFPVFFCVFSSSGGMRKPILIWCCIEFPEFSENILWWKLASDATENLEKREAFWVWGWIHVVLWLSLWCLTVSHSTWSVSWQHVGLPGVHHALSRVGHPWRSGARELQWSSAAVQSFRLEQWWNN